MMPTEDAAYLRAFEELVQSQQSASAPWQPVTDYSFEARKQVEGQQPRLIADVFKPTLALDVGCGRGGVLVRLLQEQGVFAMGFDPAVTYADTTPSVYNDSITREDRTTDIFGPYADLVICREVLEHLTVKQITQAVRNLCALSSKFVYVTTRFHPHPTHLLDVATADDLDPTHITMLNQNMLRLLFVLEGFTRRADLEQRMDWKNLGRVLVYERH